MSNNATLIHFDVITLFPTMITPFLNLGVVGGAIDSGLIGCRTIDPREFVFDVHKTVDRRPYGGGDGMIMLGEPLEESLRKALREYPEPKKPDLKRKVIYLSPQGKLLTDTGAREMSQMDHLILICGRYGGIDQRFLNRYVDEEISVGNYVLSGGEIGALAVIDSVSRFIPGVLHNQDSSQSESLSTELNGLLEAPLFTRPREHYGQIVPEILLSGDHAKVAKWRRMISILITWQKRPELLRAANLSAKELQDTWRFYKSLSLEDRQACGISESLLPLPMESV